MGALNYQFWLFLELFELFGNVPEQTQGCQKHAIDCMSTIFWFYLSKNLWVLKITTFACFKYYLALCQGHNIDCICLICAFWFCPICSKLGARLCIWWRHGRRVTRLWCHRMRSILTPSPVNSWTVLRCLQRENFDADGWLDSIALNGSKIFWLFWQFSL